MKTMTLDEIVKNPLTEKDKEIIRSAQPNCSEECPAQSRKQLEEYKPWYCVHPEGDDIYKVSVKKQQICLRIDCDILAKLKSEGKGYQSKINAILRKALFN